MTNNSLIPIIESYIIEDEPLYYKTYCFIKGYASKGELKYTLKALPLARKIHDGQYRKSTIKLNGEERHIPYVNHVLKVCSELLSLKLPLTDEEMDILAAISLLHDSLEDNPAMFPNGGEELTTEYGFPAEVCEAVRLLTKRHGATQEELSIYFRNIKRNKYALLVKLADRSNNVETLSTMRTKKMHIYVKETRDFVYPLVTYGKENYPELSNGLTILKSKILSLTEEAEVLVMRFEEELMEKDEEISRLNEMIKQNESEHEKLMTSPDQKGEAYEK